MGQRLVEQMLPVLEKVRLSEEMTTTPAGFAAFEVARDRVDSYRGDPRTLAETLRVLHTTESRPYQYAGIAYVLLTASQEDEGSYYQPGLALALEWLEKAQELAPDNNDINIIEPFIYIYEGRFEDARLVLDYLHNVAPGHYYLLRAEITFWQQFGDAQEALEWSEEAVQAAETVPQRLRVRNNMAELYRLAGDLDQALALYREAIHLTPDDGWMWHRAAALQAERGEYAEAVRLNTRALELHPDLEAAQVLQRELAQDNAKKSLPGTGLIDRLFGS